jgi:mannan endo-1,6-alpha-mannosidase
LAYGVQALYHGNQSDGVLGKWDYPPYYWWESGGAWGGMMNYWHYTGDPSYVNVTYDALVSQVGPEYDWVVPSEAFDEGNDDQAFWVFAAMSAAEHGFPEPPSPIPSWVATVTNAWELFTQRWTTANCGGGLKWQFYESNAGYYYK